MSGRHQATVKRKCADEFNFAVMESYFLSNPVVDRGKPIKGFRRRTISGKKEVCLSWVNKVFLIKQKPSGKKKNGFQHLRLR